VDAIIRDHQAQLVKCKKQIEKTREIISLSQRWLAGYQDSVGRERHTWGFCLLRRTPLIAGENAADPNLCGRFFRTLDQNALFEESVPRGTVSIKV
jgi:hypothetical protein